MQVTAIKTHKITTKDKNLLAILDRYLDPSNSSSALFNIAQDDKKRVPENSVVVVTSKIVAICEGRVISSDLTTKDKLVEKEADYYLPRHMSKYDFCISITNGTFTASAGVDESNGNGNFVLWPKNPQESANMIREYLIKKFNVHNLGVIITDSKTTPLRWGVTGFALAHSGFRALNSYVNKPDIFGRLMHVEKLSVMDSLAASAVAVMGEGSEQTPLAIITDVPFVEFVDRNPTQEELNALKISLEDDLYAPLLTSVKWDKGKKKI